MNLSSLASKLFFSSAHIGLISYYSLQDILQKPDRDKIIKSNLSPDLEKGYWYKDSPLPSYRYEFSAAAVGKTIYVVGGIREPSVWFPTSLAESYDTEKKKWKKMKNLPVALHHTGVASDERYLYVVGGNRIRITTSNLVFRYDTLQDKWERLPDMPTGRGALGAAIVNNVLYAVGGAHYKSKFSTLEALDLKTMKWKVLSPMSTPREHLGIAVSPMGLHVLGGYNTNRFGSMTTHEIYDIKKDEWVSAPPIPMPICGIMTASIDSKIFVIGGEQGWAVSKYVFEFDTKLKKWTRLSDLPVARYAGAAAAIGNNIHVIGGCEKMFSHYFSHSHDVFVLKK